jgi:hypothetical protein
MFDILFISFLSCSFGSDLVVAVADLQGYVSGTMIYDFTKQVIAFNYTGQGFLEIYQFNANVRFRVFSFLFRISLLSLLFFVFLSFLVLCALLVFHSFPFCELSSFGLHISLLYLSSVLMVRTATPTRRVNPCTASPRPVPVNRVAPTTTPGPSLSTGAVRPA